MTSSSGLLTTLGCTTAGGPEAAAAPANYMLEGSVFVAGAIIGWLRDGLGIIRDAGEVETLARSVADSGGVVLVPALTGLGSPHWDPFARGLIIGLSRATARPHIARAALESIALSVADVVAAMERDAGVPLKRLRVDGGASANDLLMQMQADVLGLPIDRPAVLETTALGAALLAGMAVGFFADSAAIDAARRVDRVFEPTMTAPVRQRTLDRWRDAVERAKRWAEPATI